MSEGMGGRRMGEGECSKAYTLIPKVFQRLYPHPSECSKAEGEGEDEMGRGEGVDEMGKR